MAYGDIILGNNGRMCMTPYGRIVLDDGQRLPKLSKINGIEFNQWISSETGNKSVCRVDTAILVYKARFLNPGEYSVSLVSRADYSRTGASYYKLDAVIGRVDNFAGYSQTSTATESGTIDESVIEDGIRRADFSNFNVARNVKIIGFSDDYDPLGRGIEPIVSYDIAAIERTSYPDLRVYLSHVVWTFSFPASCYAHEDQLFRHEGSYEFEKMYTSYGSMYRTNALTGRVKILSDASGYSLFPRDYSSGNRSGFVLAPFVVGSSQGTVLPCPSLANTSANAERLTNVDRTNMKMYIFNGCKITYSQMVFV